MLLADKLRAGILAAAAALLSWQLFLPPIVGLADQGDFVRILGRFGYRAPDESNQYTFVTRKFVHDPNARMAVYEQVSSEYIFAGAAILLSKVFSTDGMLDIRTIGFVHMLAFLYAFYRLLQVTGQVRASPLIWILALLVLTDVGYAAYWNSFYAEPASCIFFLLLLAESIAISRTQEVSVVQAARWTLWAILLVIAKTQNAPLGIVLALFALRLLSWSKSVSARRATVAGSVLIAAATTINLMTIPFPVKWPDTYNQVFLAILPESKDPMQDAKFLGLTPDWLKYSGTGAWAPGSAYHDAVVSGVIGKTITPVRIVRFYLLRPNRIWRHAKRILPVAFSLRPEWCGNFERSAGLPPGARSTKFSLWSAFHEHVLTGCGKFILIALLSWPAISLAAWWRWPSRRRYLEFCILLSVGCVLSFVAAICGDAWDNVKHLFLFNLLLDTWMVAVFAMLAGPPVRNVLHRI